MIKYLNRDTQFYIFIALTIGLIYFFSNVLVPFFIGIFIAYLLDPLVDRLEKLKFNRGLAAIIVLFFFFSIILTLLLIILPILLSQTKDFLDNFPNFISKIQEIKTNAITFINNHIVNVPKSDILNTISNSFVSYLKVFINNLLKSSFEIINLFGLIIITPIVSWYLLKDWDNFINFINKKIPKKYNKRIVRAFKDVDSILSSYLRGQFLVVILLSVYYCLFFSIIGLNYSIFIGLFSGFLAFVPIIGLLLSFILTVVLVFLQFVDYSYIIYIVLIFSFGQFLESYVLTPNLIGKKLGLHPIIIILAIFCFGSLFGIVGIIFSIPLVSIISIFLNKWIKYLNNG